jgi:hypothetical protein
MPVLAKHTKSFRLIRSRLLLADSAQRLLLFSMDHGHSLQSGASAQ